MNDKKWISFLLAAVMAVGCALSVSAVEKTLAVIITYGGETVAYTDFSVGWNKATELASENDDVEVMLARDWKADSNGCLGSGAGFRDGAILCDTVNPITLDLNGCVIDRKLTLLIDGGAVIYVCSDLTVTDSDPSKANISKQITGGVITGGANSESGGGVVVEDGASFNLNGGIIANCVSESSGGGIYTDGENTTICVNDACLYGNHSYDSAGGAIYSVDGKVTLSGALLEGNSAADDGGAIYIDDGKLKAVKSFFSGNKASAGGAVYLDDGVYSDMEECTFRNNRAEKGGAVYIDANDGTYIKNCNALANSVSSDGGAVFSEGDKVFLIGGTYKYNNAGNNGGGIYVDSMYDVNIAGKLVVSDNTVNGESNNLCLQNGTFSTAYLFCGGLYEGSQINLCSTDNDSRLAIENIDTYQYKNYIRFDKGFAQDRVEIHNESDEGIRAEGSALGNGNLLSVVILTIFVVLCFTGLIIYAAKRKKKGAANGETV